MSIRAIIYKAWRSNFRHYIQSLVKIVLPLIPIIIYITSAKDNSSGKGSGSNYSGNNYTKVFKDTIIEPQSFPLEVVYFPINAFTQKLMKTVESKIGSEGKFTYIGVDRESDIELWFINQTSSKDYNSQSHKYGIIFYVSETSTEPPVHFTYKIRGLKTDLPDTDMLFPIIQSPGQMTAGEAYYFNEFLRLKVGVDDAFLSDVGITPPNNWSLQYFPYPAHDGTKDDSSEKILYSYLPIILAIFFMYIFSTLGSFSLNEKKLGITERLRMVGMNDFMILLHYLIHGFMIYIISTAILAILFKIKSQAPVIFPNSNYLILWLVLILYCLQSTAFFLAFSALFNNPSLAASLATLAYFVPCAPILSNPNVSVTSQVFSSLLPIIYLYWSFQNIYGFEGTGLGATFSTIIKTPLSGYCDISLLGLMFLSLLSTVLLCLIYLYIVQVKPGPYGYAKPWHFIFPKKYFCRINPSNLLKNESDNGETSTALYEPVPDNVEVGLHISNLHKRFGNVTSVKELSLDIYVGQITALLGHNGAGKTTTLSMITGMHKPTSGTIHYRGYNIFSNLNAFRLDLGLCPQEDMLMGDLSVWDHLMIFAMIKGLPSKDRQISCTDALKQTMLSDKKNELIDTLSGGMKRKLCLALALVGNPKVLVLDEPTSGLDPESRREIWNILLTFRENRVMIITTHFMEEADVLGDQIAIMDHGEIKCYGSPMFLKKHYGAGYQITLSCPRPSMFEDIIQYVTSKVPDATVMNTTEEQIVFNISSSYCKGFPTFFEELESNSRFTISRIGISCTTMDDVFLKVREEADSKGKFKTTQLNDKVLFQGESTVTPRSQNLLLNFLQRFFSLIQKNILYIQSTWTSLLLMVVIIPLLTAYWAIHSTSDLLKLGSTTPISYDLNIYGSTEVLLDGPDASKIMKTFIDIIKRDGHYPVLVKDLHKNNIIDGLLQVATVDEVKYRQSLIVAGDFSETVPNVLHSGIAIHSPVIAVNLLYNTFLQAYESGKQYSISTICHPLIFSSALCSLELEFMKVIVLVYFIIWCLALCSLVGSIGIKAAHTERTSLLKHLELMTGLSPFTYWFSIFIWDLVVFSLSMALTFIIFKSFDDSGILAMDSATGVLALITILFGISGLCMAYCFTFLFKTPTAAFNLYYAGCFIVILAALVCFNLLSSTSNWYFVTYILRLIPVSSLAYAIQLFVFNAISRLQCSVCPNAYAIASCANGTDHGSLINEELEKELWYLGLDWIIYFSLIMLIEFGIFAKVWEKIEYYRIGLIQNSGLEHVEADVAKERDRVDAVLNLPGDSGTPIVIVDGLGKKYSRSFTAVYDVSFASKEGECFGLLGVNGAGKTTTFNILSGVQRPTQGRALIKGEDLNEKKRLCLSHIGYCPQLSALGESLTGRQMIKLFGNLRLVPPGEVEKVVDKWINLLGLEEYADRACGTYSGGNKRKLSTAMAFINNPAVILLDEPTSGVDPVTRRNLWTVLKNCQNNKQTIIISSHSMDECEAVCDRITIMVNGYMQCIGNTQRLKQLYGQGFIVLIKLKDTPEDAMKLNACSEATMHLISNPEDVRNFLKRRILLDFNSKASLKDEHAMLLHYHISDTSYKLSTLFSIMENICQDFRTIEEYSISDSSLEHIFLSFAKKKDEKLA